MCRGPNRISLSRVVHQRAQCLLMSVTKNSDGSCLPGRMPNLYSGRPKSMSWKKSKQQKVFKWMCNKLPNHIQDLVLSRQLEVYDMRQVTHLGCLLGEFLAFSLLPNIMIKEGTCSGDSHFSPRLSLTLSRAPSLQSHTARWPSKEAERSCKWQRISVSAFSRHIMSK